MTTLREYSLLILFTLALLTTVYLSFGARLTKLVTQNAESIAGIAKKR